MHEKRAGRACELHLSSPVRHRCWTAGRKKLFVKGDSKYDLSLFIQRWVAYNVERESGGDELSLDDVRAQHEQIKKQKTEIEVARMRGELVAIEDVYRLWSGIAHTVSANMMLLPVKVAPQIMMMGDTDLIAGILEKEIRAILEIIATTPVPDNMAKGSADEEETED